MKSRLRLRALAAAGVALVAVAGWTPVASADHDTTAPGRSGRGVAKTRGPAYGLGRGLGHRDDGKARRGRGHGPRRGWGRPARGHRRRGYDDDSFGFRVDLGHGGHDHHGRWVPGHYDVVVEEVLVAPGYHEKLWVPPVRETRYDACGNPYTVVVRPGHHEKVWVPARYETRESEVWVPGHREEVPVRHHDGVRVVVGGRVRF